jgi:hypothetical protein
MAENKTMIGLRVNDTGRDWVTQRATQHNLPLAAIARQALAFAASKGAEFDTWLAKAGKK